MKRLFLIIPPTLLFGIFIFFYQAHLVESDVQAKIAADDAKRLKEEADRKLQELRDKSAAEAREREQAKLREAKLAAEKEQAKKDEEIRQILEKTEAFLTEANRFKAEIARLQREIQKTRDSSDALQRRALAAAVEVEVANSEKRRAEFEIQRLTEAVALKATQAQTALTVKPPAPKN